MYKIINQVKEITTEMEPVTSLLKNVIIWGNKKFEERRNKTIEKFYIQLLDGEVNQKRIDYEKEHIETNSEQYYILLNLAINDEEQEKDFIYANVYRYIRDHQQLEKKDKTRLIKIVKQLPYSSLELLPSIYIYANNVVKEKSLKQLFEDMNTTYEYELKLLTQFNLLEETKMGELFAGNFRIKNTTNFNILCEAFFIKENLVPSNYNIDIWSDKKVLIIVDDEFYYEAISGNRIKEILTDLNIQSEIMHYKNLTVYGFTDAIFLTDYAEINSNFNNLSYSLKAQQNIRCIKVSMIKNYIIKDSHTIYLEDELDKFKALFNE